MKKVYNKPMICFEILDMNQDIASGGCGTTPQSSELCQDILDYKDAGVYFDAGSCAEDATGGITYDCGDGWNGSSVTVWNQKS